MLVGNAIRFRHPGQTSDYDFSFSVAPGEIVAITGASGSGKSTLLDLIAGFARSATGEIKLNDQPLHDLAPESRPVSILFQSDNLFDHLTAGQNLALALPDAPRANQAAQISSALKKVGLEQHVDQRVASLSGGEKQRVALARTLLLDRPILLLDEPFSALDEATAAAMRTLVHELVRQHQWHVLMVTHQQTDLAIADRHLHLSEGKLRPPVS